MHSTQNKDDDAEMLAGVPASSLLRRPPPGADILEFQTPHRRPVGLEDAIEPDGESSFVSIGSIAVRLVSEWSRPRMMLPASREGDAGSA